jgi:small subunit ribosomal protein S9
MADKTNNNIIWISGRRKTAVARIKLMKGKGEYTLDGMSLEQYFPAELDRHKLFQPFKVTGRSPDGFDVSIKFAGGGKKSQLDAAMLGLARALEELDPNLRPLLKDAGLLTRDPRMKERKKYGLKRARKAPQYSKR